MFLKLYSNIKIRGFLIGPLFCSQTDIESMSSNELMQLFYQYFLLVMYLSLISNWFCLLPNELAMTQNLCKVVFVEFGQSLQKENGKFTQTIVNFFQPNSIFCLSCQRRIQGARATRQNANPKPSKTITRPCFPLTLIWTAMIMAVIVASTVVITMEIIS